MRLFDPPQRGLNPLNCRCHPCPPLPSVTTSAKNYPATLLPSSLSSPSSIISSLLSSSASLGSRTPYGGPTQTGSLGQDTSLRKIGKELLGQLKRQTLSRKGQTDDSVWLNHVVEIERQTPKGYVEKLHIMVTVQNLTTYEGSFCVALLL